MKSLATNITVANLTRMACLRWETVRDEASETILYGLATIQARPSNANAGTTEAQQLACSYPPVTMKITNTVCDTYLANSASPHNQFTDRLVLGSATFTNLLNTCVSAYKAAAGNGENNAVLSTLATAGAIPPLS
jgi:hypothetical protein